MARRGACAAEVSFKPLADFSLILTGLVYSLLLAIAFGAGFLGLPLLVLVLLSFWRYAYSVLRTTAQGKTDIPAPGLETMNPISGLIPHCLVFLLFPIGVESLHPFGEGGPGRVLEVLLIFGVLAFFPASAGLMALTSSLESAFHPAALIGFMRELGRDYLRLLGLATGIVIGGRIVGFALSQIGLIGGLLSRALELWSVLAVFALTGLYLRAHREGFHIAGEREPEEERRARAARADWIKTLDLAYASIRGGLVAEGYRTLKQFSAAHGDSIEIQYWLFENMLDWEDPSHALGIARRLIERLVADGDRQRALELYMRCLRHERDFAPDPAVAAALAPYARSLGQQGVADQLEAAGGHRHGTLGYNDRSKPT